MVVALAFPSLADEQVVLRSDTVVFSLLPGELV